MEQMIPGGYYDSLHDTNTEYNSLIGGHSWRVAEADYAKIVSVPGGFSKLRVVLNGAPGAGNKYDFTLMVNGAPSALTVEIAGGNVSGSDMTSWVIVTRGDRVSLECNPDSTPTSRRATWSIVFSGSYPNESLILGGSYDTLNNGATEYAQVMGARTNPSGTENDHRQVCPTAGVIKNLYVKLDIDPGNAPDAYRFTLRKGGVSQTLTVTITADNITGNNTINQVTVAAGDVLTMMIEPLNGPATTPYAQWGMAFVATIDGESIIMGGSTDDLHNVNTELNDVVGYDSRTWSAAGNQRIQLGQICTVKKLYVLLSTSPGAGKKYDFTIMINLGNSAVVTTVDDANTTGNSGVLEDTVALDEFLGLKSNPDTVPNVADAYWGFVCYVASPVSPPAPVFFCCPFCHDASTHIWRVGPAGVRGIDDSDRFYCEACGVFFSACGETFWEAHGRLE